MPITVRESQFGVEDVSDLGDVDARLSQYGVEEMTQHLTPTPMRHSQFGAENNYNVPGDVFMTQFGVEFLHVPPVTVASGEKCDVYFVGF